MKREKGKMCKLCTMRRQERKHFSSYLHLFVCFKRRGMRAVIHLLLLLVSSEIQISFSHPSGPQWLSSHFIQGTFYTQFWAFWAHFSEPDPTAGYPGGTSGKESAFQYRWCKRHRFNPWVRKIPWRRKWQPPPVFFPGKFHGQRILAGHSPRSCKVLDRTEAT